LNQLASTSRYTLHGNCLFIAFSPLFILVCTLGSSSILELRKWNCSEEFSGFT
jgi:hypothetical protein